MSSQDDWTWPSTNCNGIPLADPVTISFQGTVVVFARQAATPVTQLYTNVRLPGSSSGASGEWAGWNPLPMTEAVQSDMPSQPTADTLPLLRLGGMDLLTVDTTATIPTPADAPFRVVTDGRTITCFRQSLRGSLYLDRFILVQVPAGGSQDPSGTGTWELRRAWEVRYRRSERRDVPNGPRDTLSSRNPVGQPFLEPTIELPVISGISGGGFDVALAPTIDPERMRWHIVAVTGSTLTCLSYPQDATGRVDLSPGTARSFTISPAALQSAGGLLSLTPFAGLAVCTYQEQETAISADGTSTGLRRTTRLMLTAPVKHPASLPAALAVYDFTVQPDGTIAAYPAGAACTVVDGTLANGNFTPRAGDPDYGVPDSAVLAAGAGTIASVLLGQAPPGAAPALIDSADGLVHLYFAGEPDGAGNDAFLVAQHDPTVTRVKAAVPWAAGSATGTLPLVGLRPGSSLNGLAVTIADCAGQADLCTITVSYGTPAGLPAETWHGVPRDALTMVDILDGQSSDDPADPAVLSGAVAWYDLDGQRSIARLPLAGGTAGAHLTLASGRPDVPLTTATVTAPSGGTSTLTLGFTPPGGHQVTQVWASVPTDTIYLVPVLAGTATGYNYAAAGTPSYGLATDGGTIVLFAAGPQPLGLTVGPAADDRPTHCTVTVTNLTDPHHPVELATLANVDRDQVKLVSALRAAPAVSALFTYISADQVAGSVPNQSVSTVLDLRGGSLLLDAVAPAPAGDLSQASVTAAILQGRTFASPPPAGVTPGRGLLALAAAAPSAPLLSARPSVVNGNCAITERGENGSWLVAAQPSALSFDEQNAMTVAHPGQFTAPTRTWTIETWARPTDGTPSRVVSYNGSATPPLAGVVPSYFLGTVGQPALQFAAFSPQTPYAGSYVNVTAYPAFSPANDQAFTWEAWVRPDAQPCPAGLLGLALEARDTLFPAVPQWQLGLDQERHLTFGLRTGQPGQPVQTLITAADPLPASVWSHVAVTASAGQSSWTITLYVGATAVKSQQGLVPYQRTQDPFLCIGASDIKNVTMFGAIAEIRFWNFAATPAELHRTLQASLTGSEPGLLGYWPLTEDPAGGTFANKATSTGHHYDGALRAQKVQPVTPSSDGSFVSIVAGIGGAPALQARAFLPANHWNHLGVVYEAAGALSLNLAGIGSALSDFGFCENSAGLVFSQTGSVESWVQMASATHLSQTILAQWGVAASNQAFQFGVDQDGHPYCTVTLANSLNSTLVQLTGSSTVNVIDGRPHHVAATFAAETVSATLSKATVIVYIDGKAQTPATTSAAAPTLQVTNSKDPVTLGISALATPATGPVAYSAQAPFCGVLTGVRFWSTTLTAAQVTAAMDDKREADGDGGVVSAWWFDEQTGELAADTVGGNDLTLSDTDMWAAFAAIATLDFYGNGVPIGLVSPAPADTTGGYGAGQQELTIGGWLDSGAVKDGFSGQLTELRLWNDTRSRDQLIETMYRTLSGDEDDLNAYWTLNGTTKDATGHGADGTLTGNPVPGFIPSLAPVANEGPQVRNVYAGPVTDFQEPLTGRVAVIEYAETETRWDGSPIAIMRRGYFFNSPSYPSLTLATGYGLGQLDMIYLGQAQTNPTLLGYIEGAPPCPSENLSRPLYESVFGYNSYLDATSVALQQAETTDLSFTSSDYRTRVQMDLDVKGGLRADGTVFLNYAAISLKSFSLKFKIGAHHTSSLTLASQRDERYTSSWTKTLTDTLGLRGMWEPPETSPANYVNPLVGRRYQPLNLGYALVESLTADVFALRLRSTGAMVGRIVVPNLAIPPDRNVLTFKIAPDYIKNGTLDGKIGLVNDPSYPDADVRRGSYFQPEDAYAREAAIDRKEVALRAYYEQFDASGQGQSGPGSPSLSGPAAEQFYDFGAGTVSRGIVNRYVWTAHGGLHSEVEQFSAVHDRTFTGLYSYAHRTGLVGEFETGSLWGVFGGLDLLFGGTVSISVGKEETDTQALSLNVSVLTDPMLQGFDNVTATYTNDYCPGKVEAYRFMTFYLPPSADNGDDFNKLVVDGSWLRFSSDPNAIALRQAQTKGNGMWRVLHRVTYVSRVPPRLDTNPNQTVAPDPPQPIDVLDNPALIMLIQAALGHNSPTLANISTAVGTVLAPPDGTSPSVLGETVPWWATFLQSTRGAHPDPDAVALMDRLLVGTVSYIRAGYEAKLLPIT